jgi:hypothetical protein
MGTVPVAITENVAVFPATTDWLIGAVVIVGPVTVVAASFMLLPAVTPAQPDIKPAVINIIKKIIRAGE